MKAAVYPGTLASTVLNDVAAELKAFEDSLPVGYSIAQFGDAEERAESFGQLFSTFFLFLGLIVMTLVMILNSFRQASIILLVGTLCIGLGFLGMFVGFQNFGFIGLVGIVGLAGLAINDSIVVLSHLNEDAGTGQVSKDTLTFSSLFCLGRNIGEADHYQWSFRLRKVGGIKSIGRFGLLLRR